MKNKRVKGKVKWFNNKLGYGFISHDSKESLSESDIFVHWSNLMIPDHEFHTLYKDEHVEFEIQKCLNGPKSVQACRVSGPKLSSLRIVKMNGYTTNYHTSSKFSNVYSVKQMEYLDFEGMERSSSRLQEIYRLCNEKEKNDGLHV
tara:strand:- start:163 stop:600 length:438 start_codon:yes stop_codon:yes gene_type:complete